LFSPLAPGVGAFLDHPQLQFFVTSLLSVLIGALPFLVVAVLASAFLETFVSRERLARLVPKNPVVGVLLAPLLGLLIPMCECGIIPVARRLMLKGVPLPVAVAFMLANPILNPLVILSTHLAFPNMPGMVWWRIGLGYGVAVGAALLISLWVRNAGSDVLLPPGGRGRLPAMAGGQDDAASGQDDAACAHAACGCGHDHAHDHPQRQPLGERLHHLLVHAGDEFFTVGRYFVLGAVLAGLVQTFLQRSTLEAIGQGPVLSVLGLMGLAYLLSICSEADAFVAASFASTFTPAALLAFLVFGPMSDVKNTLMMLSVFNRRFVLALNLVLAGLVMLGAGLAHALL
jgi:uncharacterized membrane protein YraQ (UPF0718 family)